MPYRVEGEPDSGSSPNQQEQKEQAELDKLFEFIKEEYSSPGLAASVEVALSRAKLLSGLEEAGILPVLENPNPFHYEKEEELHEQWWEEHQEEGELFAKTFEDRENTLRRIFIGALLAHRLCESG